jgi:glycine/D-amino acid oxidase-like deaminating enzyme
MSRVCTIGVRGAHKNIYYGVGYSGCGITLANLAGQVIADIFHGDTGRWLRMPFYCRNLEWAPPEPMRWVGYKIFTSLTGRSPRQAYRPETE